MMFFQEQKILSPEFNQEVHSLEELSGLLLDNELRFRRLFSSTRGIAVQICNSHRDVVFWNRASEKLYGHVEKHALGRKLEELILPEALKHRFISSVDRWFKNRVPMPAGEMTLNRADGTPVYVYCCYIMMEDAFGDPELVSIHFDISERKRVNDALLEKEIQFESLLMNIPGVVYRCTWDRDWTMRFISAEILAASGYPSSDFIENTVRSYASIIHPEDSVQVDRGIRTAIEAGKPWEIRYRILHRDGSVRNVLERGRAVDDGSGGVRYLDGFILDITPDPLSS